MASLGNSVLEDRARRVPADRVHEFDFFAAPELSREPHRQVKQTLRDAPEIFWTNCNGGHWIVARVSCAMEMLRMPDLFSSDPAYNRILDRWPRLIPNQYDPPAHTEFRAILNPWFTPRAVRERELEIRSLAAELIEAVLDRGHCEFVGEIADQFSVTIFMRMVDAPTSDRQRLLDLAAQWTRGTDQESREEGLQALARYLMDLIASRRAAPADDLLSHILAAEVAGRPLTDDELLGLTTLTFLGGLDTVAAMLSFIMAYLARSPAQYDQLVQAPERVDRVIDELMRPYGVAGMERGATGSFQFRGLDFEKGDRIVFLPQMFGLDEDWVDNPEMIDFARPKKSSPVFGGGPHRCVGAHLARAELVLFLHEWIARVPSFTVAEGWDEQTAGGLVWTLNTLFLTWPQKS